MIENHPIVKSAIRFALMEDVGPGDVTTDAVADSDTRVTAGLFAREEIVLAGLPVFREVFREVWRGVSFENYFNEGMKLPPGAEVCRVTGPLGVILKGERTALNFLQRMSGIATLTRKYVDAVDGTGTEILDTRKTAPCMRYLDKYSVRTGGGTNHRFGLYDGILIKDNHIAAAGSISSAIESARKNVHHLLKVEVEVEDIDGVTEALESGADAVLLDNMTLVEMQEAAAILKGKVVTEASGGITLLNVRDVAKCGVDYISIGALTHSPRASDFTLEIVDRI